MSERDRERAAPTEVTIHGRSYRLRGEGDGSRLVELASIVDAKMNEVARSTGTADTLKVAIMAALNIADDYLQALRDGDPDQVRDNEERLARMVTLLDDVLAG